jgi:hypothetical protein
MQTSQVCALCNSGAEDAHHLLTDYLFSRLVIHYIWAHLLTDYLFSRLVIHYIWACHNFEDSPPQVIREQVTVTWVTASASKANEMWQRQTTETLLYFW